MCPRGVPRAMGERSRARLRLGVGGPRHGAGAGRFRDRPPNDSGNDERLAGEGWGGGGSAPSWSRGVGRSRCGTPSSERARTRLAPVCACIGGLGANLGLVPCWIEDGADSD